MKKIIFITIIVLLSLGLSFFCYQHIVDDKEIKNLKQKITSLENNENNELQCAKKLSDIDENSSKYVIKLEFDKNGKLLNRTMNHIIEYKTIEKYNFAKTNSKNNKNLLFNDKTKISTATIDNETIKQDVDVWYYPIAKQLKLDGYTCIEK